MVYTRAGLLFLFLHREILYNGGMEATSLKIIKKLREAGYKAYFAGGCVRDMLLNTAPKDFDIVTDAKPDEIEKLFEKTYPVGKAFGVILVHENGHTFEVATFRSDGGYSDGRRPDFVTYSDPKEDALRRDFTINALFYDPVSEEVLDFVGGRDDLQEKIIRFVGDPEARILEDHLRLLRAVRFKNTLGFQWHPDTYNAVKKHAAKAGKVAMERARDELNKIMLSDHPVEALRELHELRMFDEIMPELEATRGVAQPYKYHHEGDVFEHTMKTLASAVKRTEPYLDLEFLKDMQGGPPEPSVFHARWAALFHDIGKPLTFGHGEDTATGEDRIRFDHHAEATHEIAGRVMKRLRFSGSDMAHILWVTEHHMNLNSLLDMPEGARNKWFRNPYFIDLMEVFHADIAGTEPSDFSTFDQVNRLYHKWLLERPEELPKLLDGEEIMKLTGLSASKELGEVIEKLSDEVHAHKITTKEQAMEFVKKLRG